MGRPPAARAKRRGTAPCGLHELKPGRPRGAFRHGWRRAGGCGEIQAHPDSERRWADATRLRSRRRTGRGETPVHRKEAS